MQHKIPVQPAELSVLDHRLRRDDASAETGSSVFADQSAQQTPRRHFTGAERSVPGMDSVRKLLHDRAKRGQVRESEQVEAKPL